MTKQEKFLLLVVLIVSGVGATLYVQNQKSKQQSIATREQVQAAQTLPVFVETNTLTTKYPIVVNPQNTNTNTNTNINTNTSVPASVTSTKKVEASYGVPNGDTENLVINVTLKNNTISDISFEMSPTNKQSAEYYNKFKNSFPKLQIIGKSLNNASLSRVGGASLTTNAYNKALTQL